MCVKALKGMQMELSTQLCTLKYGCGMYVVHFTEVCINVSFQQARCFLIIKPHNHMVHESQDVPPLGVGWYSVLSGQLSTAADGTPFFLNCCWSAGQ